MQLPNPSWPQEDAEINTPIQSRHQDILIEKSQIAASASFLNLPPEVHYHISTYLQYPDLLSLTLVHPLFRSHELVRTSKTSRVNWLIDRSFHRLPLPSRTRCRWSSDCEFVSNPEIKTILQQRRQHKECVQFSAIDGYGLQCLVHRGKLCEGAGQIELMKDRTCYGLRPTSRMLSWYRQTASFLELRKPEIHFAAFVAIIALLWGILR